jgi:hypothetical protein
VAVLTGTNNDTILLVRFGAFVIKVYPGSRLQGATFTGMQNLGQIRFYRSSDKQLVLS